MIRLLSQSAQFFAKAFHAPARWIRSKSDSSNFLEVFGNPIIIRYSKRTVRAFILFKNEFFPLWSYLYCWRNNHPIFFSMKKDTILLQHSLGFLKYQGPGDWGNCINKLIDNLFILLIGPTPSILFLPALFFWRKLHAGESEEKILFIANTSLHVAI